MKKLLALFLAILSFLSIFSTLPTTVSAATSSALATTIKSLCPIVTYAYPASGAAKVYAYSDSTLRTKQSGYYINSFSEEIVIVDISSDGKAVKVRYLNDYGQPRTKYYKASDIFGLTSVSVSEFATKSSMTVYRMSSSSSTKKYGSIYKGSDRCISLGVHTVGKTKYHTAIYKLSSSTTVNGISAKYKMGLVTQSSFNTSAKTISDNQKNAATSTSFSPVFPCKDSRYISTLYRYWNSGQPSGHAVRSNIYNAFDVSGKSGDKILAIEYGVVLEKGYQKNGFGHFLVLDHGNGLCSLYGHLRDAAGVNVGDTVKKGSILGYMGSTGNSTGTHLHFELYSGSNKKAVINPWVTYYQGKVSVTIGGNSYRANKKYTSDAYAVAWCKWLQNNCKKNSSGDFVYKA